MKSKPNQELVNYIWTYLHQGYSLTSIRDSLIHQNYVKKDINLAVDYIYANYYYGENPNPYKKPYPKTQSPPHHVFEGIHHLTLKSLILMGIVLIGFSFVLVIFLNLGSEEIISPDAIDLTEDFNETTEVVNDITPEIVNDNSSGLVNDNSSKIVDLNEEESKIVVPERTYSGDISEGFDTDISYTNRQVELKVDYFSSRNPKEAIKFCNYYSRDIETYFCYRDVAIGSGNPAYCDLIGNQTEKDDCYLSCVLENVNSGSVCNNIVESKKKDNCYKIVDINEKAKELGDLEVPDEPKTDLDEAADYYGVVANFY